MPGINHPIDERLAQIIADHDRRIRAMETQQQQSFTDNLGRVFMTTGLVPGSDPAEYGLLVGNPANAKSTAFFGQTQIPDGSGRTQVVTEFARDDGTTAFAIYDGGTVPGHVHQQAAEWFDRTGHTVFSDDSVSGVGVARPHLTLPQMTNTNTATWPATNATAWTDIADCYAEIQQPKLTWVIALYAPASTTGAYEMVVAGTTLSSTTVVGGASGTFNYWTDTQPIPAGVTFGSIVTVILNAQVTAGTGTILARPMLLQGTQS